MDDVFVSYELAIKLKEEGFFDTAFGYYSPNGLLITQNVHLYHRENYFDKSDKYYIAPLFQQVVNWFRDKHKIEIVVFPKLYGGSISYGFDCVKTEQRSTEENLDTLTKGIYVLYNSSKDCHNAAFDETLEMISK